MRNFMHQPKKFIGLIIATVLSISFMALSLNAQTQLTEQSKLVIDGIGPIRVGMTVAEAETTARVKLVEKGGRAGGGGCYYLWPQKGLQYLGLMAISNQENSPIDRTRDRIVRVDIFKGSSISTLSGAKIGDTEAQIMALYPGRIKVTSHQYTGPQGGHYLTYTPKDSSDKNFRIVFETLKGRVTQFRSGKLPEVAYVEGCA
jgi:hypothetical protein